MNTDIENLFEDKVLGHPAGLFVLFFTEMWERFSFYGMRVLLFNFLTMAFIGYNPGWEWSAENAGALFGTYAGLLYLTPILGGIIADKFTGYRFAVVIGALVMTLGHLSMAFDTETSLYVGLALLVIGTGFFKPNITSVISEMYKKNPEKKDGAFTIYYMGVNAGAFFGMMMCGYLAERVGWAWGFGLAGVFMLLGTIQFWLSKDLFGKIGARPSEIHEVEITPNVNEKNVKPSLDGSDEKPNPFTLVDKILIIITSIIGLTFLINDPLSKIANIDLFPFDLQIRGITLPGQIVIVLIGLLLFLYLAGSRISRYSKVVRDRMIAFVIFAFFTVFFWLSFEQGASSLVLFARDNVNREMEGSAATIFNMVNVALTIIPLAFISYVLFLLWKKTFKKIALSNIILVLCFSVMWGIAGWMLNRDLNTTAYEVSYQAYEVPVMDKKTGKQKVIESKKESNTDNSSDNSNLKKTETLVFSYPAITINDNSQDSKYKIVEKRITVGEPFLDLKNGEAVQIITKNKDGDKFNLIATSEKLEEIIQQGIKHNRDNGIVAGTITQVKDNWVEITVSWFSILNSFFIIVFASFFSKWFESKYNPSAAAKYALGLIIMAIGFGLLAYGSHGMIEGTKVSMVWLILAYLFHTLGELSLSPVGLSYVSKLVPARMIALMFGMWYLAIAIGNKLAAVLGGQIENITEEYSLSVFFLIFTIVPAVAGILVFVLNPILKKLMHGVR